jgi:hypothetical protein
MNQHTSSRFAVAAGRLVLAGAGLFGAMTPAHATDLDITTTVTTSPAIDPTEVPLPTSPRVNLSTTASPSYASYTVILDPYNPFTGETFDPVYFRATTTVVNVGVGEPPVAGQAAAFDLAASLVPPGSTCAVTTTLGSATSTIECRLTFSPPLVSHGANSPPFTLTVKAPTAGQRIKFVSETRWFESVSPHSCSYYGPPPGNFPPVNSPCLESEGVKPAIYFDLLSPTANPTIAQTVLPFTTGGTVTTGSGAATCENPWVVSVKVPQAATVSLNSAPAPDTPPIAATCSTGNCQFFAKVAIPLASFAPTNPLVTTLRRDRCTIEGHGIIGKALQILEESIYYRGDHPLSTYAKVYSCHITGGPVPGIPCIKSRGIYTIFNLPNVPDKLQYLGDHFWIIHSTENGKWGAP